MLHQKLSDIDEIGEGVLLVQQAAVLKPLTPHLLAAAHVGDRHNESAVQQAYPIGSEQRVGGKPIGAVGVLVYGRSAVERRTFAISHRHWNLRAVARGSVQVFGGKVGRVVAAEHGLSLFELLKAGAHVVVVGEPWRNKRAVDIAHDRTFDAWGFHQRHRVRRLAGLNDNVSAAIPGLQAQLQ